MSKTHEFEQKQSNQDVEVRFHVCKSEKYMKT